MISAADLAGMQDTLEESLPDSCQIQRNTPTSDGSGGQTDVWATVATVACRLSPLSRTDRLAELELAARVAAVSSWIVTVPASADVTEKDRIVTGGRSLEVASVLGPRSWEIGRRLLVQEVE